MGMQPEPALVSTDREFKVPAGHVVKTGYVHVKQVQFALYNRMSMEAVEKSYRKHLQLGSAACWPPPFGYWQEETFIVLDGRHEVVGAMVAGKDTVFVAWLDKPE